MEELNSLVFNLGMLLILFVSLLLRYIFTGKFRLEKEDGPYTFKIITRVLAWVSIPVLLVVTILSWTDVIDINYKLFLLIYLSIAGIIYLIVYWIYFKNSVEYFIKICEFVLLLLLIVML